MKQSLIIQLMKLVSVLFMINNSVYISVSFKNRFYTEKNHTELVRVLRESARIIVMLTAVVITVCLFSEDILYFFGKYIEGKQALLILMVNCWFFFELLRYI
jgi:hypothetical protein